MTPGNYKADPSTETWTAGGKGSFTIDPYIAAHSGGSCQASMSFDSGKTFQVLASFEGGCPRNAKANDITGSQTFEFPIPNDVPNGYALFSWTWFPVTGIRDMYMNCAVVNIKGGVPTTLSYSNPDLPPMFVGNINQCSTPELTNLKFPNPGKNLVRDTSTGYPFVDPTGSCGNKETGGGGPLNANCKGAGPNLNADAAGGGYGGGSGAAPPPSYSSPAAVAPPPSYSPPAAVAPPPAGPPAGNPPIYATNLAGSHNGQKPGMVYETVTRTVMVTVGREAPAPTPSQEVTVTMSGQMTVTMGDEAPTGGSVKYSPGNQNGIAKGNARANNGGAFVAIPPAAPSPKCTPKYGPGDENGIDSCNYPDTGVQAPPPPPPPAQTHCTPLYGPGDENGIDSCNYPPSRTEAPVPAPPARTGCVPKYGPGDENGIDSCSDDSSPLPVPSAGSGIPKYGPGDENGIEQPKQAMMGGCPVPNMDSTTWPRDAWMTFCKCLNNDMDPNAIKNFAAIQHYCTSNFSGSGSGNASSPTYPRKRWESKHYVHRVKRHQH
jgi:hypothetical protein